MLSKYKPLLLFLIVYRLVNKLKSSALWRGTTNVILLNLILKTVKKVDHRRKIRLKLKKWKQLIS